MKLSNLVLLVAGSLMAGRGLAESADLSLRGPCTPRSHQLRFPVPSELQANKLPAYLSVNVTLPDCGSAAGVQLPFGPAPFPVLFFFNGFMNRAGWYHRLMQRVASWGVATVQYDTPFVPIITVASEVQLFPHLVEWVAQQGADPASPLHGQVDTARAATGGHSRGGKLATLAFTGYPELVRAAYLVDPVDVTRWSPESPDNPSAVRALAASGLAVGMTGAGVVGACNPAEAGYRPLFAAAANGSWLGVVPGASHSQFIDAGCVTNAAADLLCGKGGDSRRQVAELTATPLLAWLWSQLQGQAAERQLDGFSEDGNGSRGEGGGAAPASLLPSFFAWVLRQQAAGSLEFEVKGSEEDGSTWVDDVQLAAPAPAHAEGWAAEPEEEEEEDCEPALASARATDR